MTDPNSIQPTLLVILDGFGLAPTGEWNAIARAKAPFIHSLLANPNNAALECSGEAVGLPCGVMGNSEVGHMSIGAGRVIYQDLTKINREIELGDFFKNQTLLEAIQKAQATQKRLHLIGLISDGGVHSHMDHLFALLDLCKAQNFKDVSVHGILDGRDCPPQSAVNFIEQCEAKMQSCGIGKFASLSGRYFAMDRDQRWERVEKAYQAMCGQAAHIKLSASEVIKASYGDGKNDEFLEPIVLDPRVCIQENDQAILFNFRADRMREISAALGLQQFDSFQRSVDPITLTCFTEYKKEFPFPVAYPKVALSNLIGDVVADAGLKQLRAAETEKYAHVTFFLNGGKEKAREGETRILIDSPKDVATYDQKPEMSAFELSDAIIKELQTKQQSLVVANFANADMVGHTGIFAAAISAVEALSVCLEKLIQAAQANSYQIFITADHGNIESMRDEKDRPHTQHTLNPVPLIHLSNLPATKKIQNGSLADIMPTVIASMGLNVPKDVTGKNLLG